MQKFPIGKGESRVATVEFANLIPSGESIGSATAKVEDLSGTEQTTGWTLGTPQVSGTDVLVSVAVAESVAAGHYQLEVEATLSNGEEVQGRDRAGHAMRLVVRD